MDQPFILPTTPPACVRFHGRLPPERVRDPKRLRCCGQCLEWKPAYKDDLGRLWIFVAECDRCNGVLVADSLKKNSLVTRLLDNNDIKLNMFKEW